ncbi:kinesin-domain-containing protein [Guyanagaster necrorhizus]|uniref:Kinesin-domain-containing protein n=1 Tax=Guyanagaster necrorhizus TaxID=856835 RepID=A0A9P7VYT0_9AGAR|nr:kinesin-domain-containing protein [Guyanagaster necrorhizus MCA 3950]KAG7449439.1 kinesin-domain-containing protein [Guyanagaster necrorhizus MCA 3950]
MVAAGSIIVAVRVRPPTSWEAGRLPEPCYDTTIRGDGTLSTPKSVANTSSLREVVQIVDDRILTFDPDEKDRAKAFVERGFTPPGTKRYKDRRFMFDKVFDHEARQQHVYEATAQPLLKGLLDGYNATVFAYGATGCGKTHTISGTESDPGIIYLTMADLFQRIEDRREESIVDVSVTFLEIYNEEIRDLLAAPGAHMPRGGLSIREDKTVKVVGLTELKPTSAEEVKEIVLSGNSRRTQSPTHANETSSRSHAVLQIHITQSPRTASLSEQRTVGTLSIIDLAGSERAAATTNMGQRMVEGANINKSLLALGNCINALCESGGGVRHVPYRNSKLTRLLKFSLGGNCKTVMIVCVAPTSNHFDDTHNTLVYAERATKIKTKVVTRNVVNVDRHVGQYVEAINRLNIEIAELKAKVAGKNMLENDIVRRKKSEAAAEVERAKEDMKVKSEQTKDSIVEGAACSGKISVANIKLGAIRARLSEIDTSHSLSADLQAERALLQILASPEEQAIKPGSALSIMVQRSSNSRAMFDATMRAVSERKSEKLDDVSIENVKLDAIRRKAEMEMMKAQEEKGAMQNAVEDMARMMVALIGMLSRSTVAIGGAAKALDDASQDELPGTSSQIANLLASVREKNDDNFTKLIGQSTRGYNMDSGSNSVLDTYKSYEVSFTRRVSSDPGKQNYSRSSSYGANTSISAYSSLSASPRRSHRSPRKSLRSSLVSQPYRRVSDKEKKIVKAGKSVQWRDEVGRGDLDDGGARLNSVSVTVIPPSPHPVVDVSVASGSGVQASPSVRPASRCGSESEWEDDEKTDDSVHLSMSLPASTRDIAPSNHSYGSIVGKRPRASRLDPGFLKSRSRGPALGSLAEGDESEAEPERRLSQPLAPRSLNSEENILAERRSWSASRENQKGRATSGRRISSASRSVASTPGKSRRRSNIGPLRGEKARRRSSMIPQLSPPNGHRISHGESSKPRRILLASPSKRAKRLSLTSRGMPALKLRSATGSRSSFSSNLSVMDGNTSADISMNRSFRPSWR